MCFLFFSKIWYLNYRNIKRVPNLYHFEIYTQSSCLILRFACGLFINWNMVLKDSRWVLVSSLPWPCFCQIIVRFACSPYFYSSSLATLIIHFYFYFVDSNCWIQHCVCLTRIFSKIIYWVGSPNCEFVSKIKPLKK